LGHLTRKNPSPYDLYCVGGTQSINQSTTALAMNVKPINRAVSALQRHHCLLLVQ